MKEEILVVVVLLLLQWRLDPYVDLLPETYHHPEDSDLKKKFTRTNMQCCDNPFILLYYKTILIVPL